MNARWTPLQQLVIKKNSFNEQGKKYLRFPNKLSAIKLHYGPIKQLRSTSRLQLVESVLHGSKPINEQ